MNCVYLKQKMNRTIYCKKKNENITFKDCSNCEYKEYLFPDVRKPITKKTKKHKLTKATDIPTKLKKKVWERDNHKCIFCGTSVSWHYANSHYIKRSQLGLGIEKNIMTNCERCHKLYEESKYREPMKDYAKNYFISLYPDWNEGNLVYKKK